MKVKEQLHVRWMIRRDMGKVMEIDLGAYPNSPWGEDQFILMLRKRNVIGMVCEHDDETVGFMLYELQKSRLVISRFAVDPWYTRNGIGTKMIDKLTGKLYERRARIVVDVVESNMEGQLFLRAMGFRAVDILKGSGEDEYVMEYRLP
jgi:ribosomal protein S18 acetylase RimI-like enzyme